jgi:nucleoside-diphosphate-sugar epimerase
MVKYSDIVYHMAAIINVDKSIDHPQETMDVNLIGTQNVLNACRRYNKPIVFASTSEIYGTHDVAISEESPTRAQSPYAVSKLAADKLCGNYHTLYGTEVYRVRCFNTFGPYQSGGEYGAVIPLFTQAYIANKKPQVFGDGEQLRDYTYIDDVVRAYEFIPTIPQLNGDYINVGTGVTISVNRIAELIAQRIGVTPEVEHVQERVGEVRKLQADVTKLKSLGFELEYNFEHGLNKYISWVYSRL